MRSGFAVQMFGQFDGELAELPDMLRAMSVDFDQMESLSNAAESPSPLRLIALRGRLSLAELQRRKLLLNDRDIATVAVLPSGDASLVAMATAIDCDDILIWPLDQAELSRRLENLRNLARRRREWHLRQAVIAQLSPTPRAEKSYTRQKKLAVLLAGPIGSAGGRIADMMQPAQVVYAESSQAITSHLQKCEYDLVFADLSMSDGDWVTLELPPHTLRAWIADPAHDLLRRREHSAPASWFDDLLPAGIASDLLRARLRILRRLATIGCELGHIQDESIESLIIDGETQCFNGSFARAYRALRTEDRRRTFAVLDMAPPDIAALVREMGFARLGSWFPEMARSLKRNLRCDDLICHLGDGRFRIILQECDDNQAASVATRISDISSGRLQLLADGQSRRKDDLQPA